MRRNDGEIDLLRRKLGHRCFHVGLAEEGVICLEELVVAQDCEGQLALDGLTITATERPSLLL